MRLIPHLGTLCVGALTAGVLVGGCDDPNTDTFRRNGGAAPDPTGVIEGTVLYVGSRPDCVRAGDDGTGEPTEIIGNVILTLFVFDNPPPPSGSASSATSLLTIPGETMFSLNDCMPLEPTAEDRRPIMRSAPFIWPELSLGRGVCEDPDPENPTCPGTAYQIRGFFDYDGDFNPFFSVRNLPTAGDVAGGAFISTSAVPPQFQRIAFGHIDENPNGQVVEGVAVTLGAPVSTERPVFQVADQTRALDSRDTLPTTPDPIMREAQLLGLTNMRLDSIVDATAGAQPSSAWQNAFTAAGIDSRNYFFGSPAYGFYVAPVDANNDGMQDAHPILGTANINYFFPVPIVRRARTPAEQRSGLPDVLIVGSIPPTTQNELTTGGFPVEVFNQVRAGIPPIAVMITNPQLPSECRVPIIAPGNTAETYERIWVDCQELPSGNYDVNLLSGVAGAQIVNAIDQCLSTCTRDPATCETICNMTAPRRTETGNTHCRDNPARMTDPMAPARLCSGSASGQAWSVPNELGCPDFSYRIGAVNQLDPVRGDGSLPLCGEEGSAMLAEQGRAGGWSIVDAADDTTPEQVGSFDPGHGIPACTMAPRVSAGGASSPVAYMPANPACCPASLDVFCGLPLCPLRNAATDADGNGEPDLIAPDPALGMTAPEPYSYPEAVVPGRDGTTRSTREMRVPGTAAGDGDYHIDDDDRVVPHCTPFLMPAGCCQIAEACRQDPEGEACPR
ncbi:hypothetical protein [Sandaracinus amylolyticus]|uniref:hypothetical protein n=1 Tax=Sandaracinus amylolyticus TaxID=927083 RepID=UPI001F1DAE2C|nr:hypothetical protein [Sandaracinus amylolyticus]UJR84297.1 Hypothetical protein I5071_63750 [Sandaracinus amylolyticus]